MFIPHKTNIIMDPKTYVPDLKLQKIIKFIQTILFLIFYGFITHRTVLLSKSSKVYFLRTQSRLIRLCGTLPYELVCYYSVLSEIEK